MAEGSEVSLAVRKIRKSRISKELVHTKPRATGEWLRTVQRGKKSYSSVVDMVAALTNSKNPRDYWYRMKKRKSGPGGAKLSTLCRQLRLQARMANTTLLTAQTRKI